MKKLLFIVLLMFSVTAQAQSQSFNNGEIYLGVTNAGSTLFGAPDQSTLQITRVSILVSGNQNEVFDYLNDADSSDTASVIDPPEFADFNVRSMFDNSFSFLPPAYEVELNAYGWIGGSYAVSHYKITNIDSVTYDAKVGFEVLPVIDNTFGNEFVEYYSTGDYIRIHKDTISTFVGVKLLSSPITSLYIEDWVSGYNKSDTALYNGLFYGSVIDTFLAADSGSVLIPSIESQTIAPGETIDIYLALAVGVDELSLDISMTEAVERYFEISTTPVNDEEIPKSISLEQNYPNPFNPSTTIKFSLPRKQFVEIKVYNSIGQLVENLISREVTAGNHEVLFNAGNLASGIYFYTLKTGNSLATKKMILLR